MPSIQYYPGICLRDRGITPETTVKVAGLRTKLRYDVLVITPNCVFGRSEVRVCARKRAILHQIFCGFPPSCNTHVGLVLWNRSRPLPSTYLSFQYACRSLIRPHTISVFHKPRLTKKEHNEWRVERKLSKIISKYSSLRSFGATRYDRWLIFQPFHRYIQNVNKSGVSKISSSSDKKIRKQIL